MVHHTIIDLYEFYPFECLKSPDDASIIEDCTGLSYDEVCGAMNGLTRKGVLSIENGMIRVVKHEGYSTATVCLEREWQAILSQVKDLRERLVRISLPQQRTSVHVRGRVGWWNATTLQNALSTVEKYRRLQVAKQENLMYAQALLWQVVTAVEALEQV